MAIILVSSINYMSVLERWLQMKLFFIFLLTLSVVLYVSFFPLPLSPQIFHPFFTFFLFLLWVVTFCWFACLLYFEGFFGNLFACSPISSSSPHPSPPSLPQLSLPWSFLDHLTYPITNSSFDISFFFYLK